MSWRKYPVYLHIERHVTNCKWQCILNDFVEQLPYNWLLWSQPTFEQCKWQRVPAAQVTFNPSMKRLKELGEKALLIRGPVLTDECILGETEPRGYPWHSTFEIPFFILIMLKGKSVRFSSLTSINKKKTINLHSTLEGMYEIWIRFLIPNNWCGRRTPPLLSPAGLWYNDKVCSHHQLLWLTGCNPPIKKGYPPGFSRISV